MSRTMHFLSGSLALSSGRIAHVTVEIATPDGLSSEDEHEIENARIALADLSPISLGEATRRAVKR